ncbi:MAG TPA: aminotransferase class IV, partial [Sphingomonas sp.]|nr:aminotransferase class IV [Sphingomonas sp.]
MTRIAYVNGAFLPIEEARISVFDRSFLFADGVYEVTTVIGGRMIDIDSHMARLERSVGEIGMRLAEPIGRIAAIQQELIERNALTEGVVYLQATRGAADRDFLPAPDLSPTLVIFTQAKPIVDTPA